MANEVSQTLTTYASSLARDYPSWNVYVEELGSPDEPEHPAWVRLSVERMQHNQPVNRYERQLLLDVTFTAQFNWRVASAATHKATEVLDRAATFMAWLKIVGVARAEMQTERLTPTSPYSEADDATRREILVRWTVPVAVTTEYAQEGPTFPEVAEVTLPLTEIRIGVNGTEEVYPQ